MSKSPLFTPLEIKPHALSESAVEEVRRHSASYAEQNLVATIDNLRQRLQEVETELEGARAQIEQIRR
jgi:hypothetical protein